MGKVKKTKEKAEIPEEASSKPSVFSQNSTSASSDSSASVFSSDAETDGHIIGIDPGHQSESVDMSAPEPNGPGSSEMKAKCTSGGNLQRCSRIPAQSGGLSSTKG